MSCFHFRVRRLLELQGFSMWRSKSLFALVAFIFTFSSVPNSVRADVAKGIDRLYSVRKIYIGRIQDENGSQMIDSLKRELERSGFTVIDNPRLADAVLNGSVEWELKGAGDSYEISRYIHSYELILPNGEEAWRATIEVAKGANREVTVSYQAHKIVERLRKDWKDSARRANASISAPSNVRMKSL